MSKRDLVLRAFNNEEVERVPVGFWFHHLNEDEFGLGLERPDLIQKNILGHKKYIEEVDPDFVKIMSDGYFHYQSEILKNINSVERLNDLKTLGAENSWIKGQVELVKNVVKLLDGRLGFYNIFAPATLLRFTIGHEKFIEFYKSDKEIVKAALKIIGEDLKTLSELVVKEGGADGIYLSVQNPDSNLISNVEYLNYIGESDKLVLNSANEVSENNILHLCGYAGHKNDLSIWKDYNAKVFNWAVNIEGLSLEEGKKLFNKAVLGGFDSRGEKLLHKGERKEIEAFTEKLLAENGNKGIILGGDCTVPSDIELFRIKWVLDKAKELSKK